MFYTVKTPVFIQKLLPNLLWQAETHEKTVYLTFDDGPTPQLTNYILKLLNQYHAKATFFCIGSNIEAYPLIFNEIIEQGHSVGNHTYHHLNGWHENTQNYLNDVALADKLIHSKLFRPPYGKLKPSHYHALKKQYKIIMWNIMNGDFKDRVTKEQCLERIVHNVKPGSIIVMHDKERIAGKVKWYLPKLLAFLQENQYNMNAL